MAAAERNDVPALTEILGSDGVDLVVTEDTVLDRNQMTAFAAEARQQTRVVRESTNMKVGRGGVGSPSVTRTKVDGSLRSRQGSSPVICNVRQPQESRS